MIRLAIEERKRVADWPLQELPSAVVAPRHRLMMERGTVGTLGLDLGAEEPFTKDDARPDDPGAAADRTNLRMRRLTAATGKPAARHAIRTGDPDFSGAAAPRAGLRQFDFRFLDA